MINWHNFELNVGNRLLFTCTSFELKQGDVIALLGKNGSGKSTFLKTLCGLIPTTSGTWEINGEKKSILQRQILLQIVSYVPVKQPVYGKISLKDVVLSGNAAKRNFLDMVSAAEERKASELLNQFHIANLAEHLFYTLSDGEQKLGLLAKAAIQHTDYLVLDEPEAFLDVGNRKKMFAELKKSAEQGKAVLFSTHQPELALNYATHIAYIHAQKLHIIPAQDYRPELLELIFT